MNTILLVALLFIGYLAIIPEFFCIVIAVDKVFGLSHDNSWSTAAIWPLTGVVLLMILALGSLWAVVCFVWLGHEKFSKEVIEGLG